MPTYEVDLEYGGKTYPLDVEGPRTPTTAEVEELVRQNLPAIVATPYRKGTTMPTLDVEGLLRDERFWQISPAARTRWLQEQVDEGAIGTRDRLRLIGLGLLGSPPRGDAPAAARRLLSESTAIRGFALDRPSVRELERIAQQPSGVTLQDVEAEIARRAAAGNTVAELGRRVKQKYPGSSDDLSDEDVGRRIQQKYPGSYDDFVDPERPESDRARKERLLMLLREKKRRQLVGSTKRDQPAPGETRTPFSQRFAQLPEHLVESESERFSQVMPRAQTTARTAIPLATTTAGTLLGGPAGGTVGAGVGTALNQVLGLEKRDDSAVLLSTALVGPGDVLAGALGKALASPAAARGAQWVLREVGQKF